MKKILLAFFTGILMMGLYGQAPEGFSFQSVVRDGFGQPVINQTVAFRFSIIKGSPTGAISYRERHTVTTDAFGSVSLSIGNGTEKTGSFETIDWGGDKFFLKVELDPAGGYLYTDMGTTQLLSVPYALYAKTASNGFSGNYNDLSNKPVTDGSETKVVAGSNMVVTGSGTIASPYRIINGFSGDYNDLRNKPVVDGSESRVAGGNNIIVTGGGTNIDPYIINEKTHFVGESYGGGVVFHVYDNGRHGLIAAAKDQDPAIQWDNGVKRYTNTTGDGTGAGEINTILIISFQTNDNPLGNFAAKKCADYSVTVDGVTYGDWYLPSKHELDLLFLKKNIIGGISGLNYWSSTEFSSVSAWNQNFNTGIQSNLSKNIPHAVRAIRKF